MTLKDLNIGETAVVGTVGGEGALRQHFLDMGLIPGEEVTLVKFAPMGDPMELSIHGYELGWVAEYGIEEMCADSWNWQKKNPDGYHTAN